MEWYLSQGSKVPLLPPPHPSPTPKKVLFAPSRSQALFLFIPPHFSDVCLRRAAIFEVFFCTIKHPQAMPEQLDFPGGSFSMDSELEGATRLRDCPPDALRASLLREVCTDLGSPRETPAVFARISFHSFPPFPKTQRPQRPHLPAPHGFKPQLQAESWNFLQEFSEKKTLWKTPNPG